MNIKVFLILVFILMKSVFVFAQQNDIDKQAQIAKNLFSKEKYFDAITEYKRLLFFDDKKEYSYLANFMIGKSYKMGAKFSEAILFFTKSEIEAQNFNEIYNSKIEKIRCNILRRTTENAINLLEEMEADFRFNKKLNEIYYWLGWANIFADDWESASQFFEKSKIDSSLINFCKDIDEQKYSVTWALIGSAVLPGFGQFYTGNYLSGILSLGWNILWGYTTINAFAEDRIFDGFAVGNLLWLRFYNGNLQNAKKFAEENNLDISNIALAYLQYKFEGLKP